MSKFARSSKNCEKLEKSQFLLKSIKSRACKPGHKSKLMKINSDKLKELNKKIKRKRMVNINYLIRKILQEMGNAHYKKCFLRHHFRL